MVSISHQQRLLALSRMLILFQFYVALGLKPNLFTESQLQYTPRTDRNLAITFLTPATPLHTVSTRINSKRLIPQDIDISKCLMKRNSLLCNEASNYPWREVQKILSLKILSLEYFGNDSLSSSDLKTNIKSNEINEHQFCKFVETIQVPKIARNKDLDLRYIIQGDTPDTQRGIRTEACLSPMTSVRSHRICHLR
ncbi:uncharacterized protein LOC135849027 isoform X2 [Planococcus citri]|uniref:uncharacterized protein LOC135849027 isoform X2 n=1 Tax=Planococcus citri TaxID=170843 RepID=UPI0031F8A5C1